MFVRAGIPVSAHVNMDTAISRQGWVLSSINVYGHEQSWLTLLTTPLTSTSRATITATRFCRIRKHVLFCSFSAPIGFSWNGSQVSLCRRKTEDHRQTEEHVRGATVLKVNEENVEIFHAVLGKLL